MLIVNYRPSTRRVDQWPYYAEISLAELNAAQTDALVEELIGGGAELADIRRRVAERSAGNPFFAEELARSLTENPLQTVVGSSLPPR